MDNKGALIATVAVLLVTLSYCSTKELPAKTLKKNFAEINRYLETNERSNDAEINMAKAEEFLKEKSRKRSLFGGNSLVETLNVLFKLSTLRFDHALCNDVDGRLFMENIDSALADGSRLKEPNYHLTRIDKIIEHYAYDNTRHCRFAEMAQATPRMKYTFKQFAYKNIETQLTAALPEEDDIEANMAKAEELLKGLNPPDGALGEALKQFLMLKSLMSEDTCNEKGFEILFKNNLAIRGQTESLNRVYKIFMHFVKKHDDLCEPVTRMNINSGLKKLDQKTYRNILGFVSSYYLTWTGYPKLVDDLKHKEVNEEFTVPTIVHKFEETLKNSSPNNLDYIGPIQAIWGHKLYHYVKAVSTEVSEIKFFDEIAAEKPGKRVVDEDEIKKLLNKYICDPCDRYVEVLGPLLEAAEYRLEVNKEHQELDTNKILENLSYHLAQQGYRACKQAETIGQEQMTSDIMAYANYY